MDAVNNGFAMVMDTFALNFEHIRTGIFFAPDYSQFC